MAEHNVGIVKHLLHLHGPIGTPPNIVSCNKRQLSDCFRPEHHPATHTFSNKVLGTGLPT